MMNAAKKGPLIDRKGDKGRRGGGKKEQQKSPSIGGEGGGHKAYTSMSYQPPSWRKKNSPNFLLRGRNTAVRAKKRNKVESIREYL